MMKPITEKADLHCAIDSISSVARFQTAFFDLDGTLTDSAPGILNSIRYALNKLGAPIPETATLNRFLGPPLIDSFERYCGFDSEKAAKALEEYRVYFTGGGMFENRVYDGIVEMLENLISMGVRCYVATAKPEVYARRITDRFGLTRYFTDVFGATLDEKRNTKDAVIKWAQDHAGGKMRTVMIGDRANDIDGAIANGLDSIGVLWGYGDADELSRATHLASSPGEIVSMFQLQGET